MWGYFLYAFSAAVPSVEAEFGASKAVVGLHGSFFAVGTVLSGFVIPALVPRWGRRRTIITSLLLAALGMAAIVVGPSLAVTLPGAVTCGTGAATMLALVFTTLTAHHGQAASAALSESTSLGAVGNGIGPLVVGATVALGWGWRPALAVPVVVALALTWLMWRLPRTPALDGDSPAAGGTTEGGTTANSGTRASTANDDGTTTNGRPIDGGTTQLAHPSSTPSAPTGRPSDPANISTPVETETTSVETALPTNPTTGRRAETPTPLAEPTGPAPSVRRGPSPYVWFVLLVMVSQMLELGLVFWTAQLLIVQTGTSDSAAASGVSAIVVGLFVSRAVVGTLSLRRSSIGLLVISFAISLVGWVVMWLATALPVALIGLLAIGIGFGALYPLSIALALRYRTLPLDAAQARMQLIVGAGTVVGPFALGWLSDLTSIHYAVIAIPVLIVLGLGGTAAGARASRTASTGVTAL
jgi:MFS family permease